MYITKSIVFIIEKRKKNNFISFFFPYNVCVAIINNNINISIVKQLNYYTLSLY